MLVHWVVEWWREGTFVRSVRRIAELWRGLTFIEFICHISKIPLWHVAFFVFIVPVIHPEMMICLTAW
jgi:hypothetical protein